MSAFGWGVAGIAVFGVYANVFSDDTSLREETARLAGEHAGCGELCRFTKTEIHRSVLEYRADYEVEGMGTTRVICRRSAISVGAEECRVQ